MADGLGVALGPSASPLPVTPDTHPCRWPGCTKHVPYGIWGCQTHWFKLPQDIRTAIFNAIGAPERAAAAKAAADWLAANHPVQEKLI